MSSDRQPNRELILTVVQKTVSDLIAVYQFGSTVEGGEHSESDLDLAVLAPRPLNNVDRWVLQEELAAQLRRDVDLVDLRAGSTVMQMQVLKTDGSQTEE